MSQLKVSIVSPLSPPTEGTTLTVFASNRNYTPEYDSAKMISAACRYAKEHNTYTVPERFVANGYLCLSLISPEGEPVAVQRACHLNIDYRGVFKRDDTIHVFETSFGKVSLLVDVDINRQQVVKSAVLKGAQIIISSQFIQLFDFNEDRVFQSANNSAISNSISVVSSISSGGSLVNPDGEQIAPYSDFLPISGAVTVDDGFSNIQYHKISSSMSLLLSHQQQLTDEPGGPNKNDKS